MKTLTMTNYETIIYDAGTEPEYRELMLGLRERARAMREDHETVEIVTEDGIVVDVVQ